MMRRGSTPPPQPIPANTAAAGYAPTFTAAAAAVARLGTNNNDQGSFNDTNNNNNSTTTTASAATAANKRQKTVVVGLGVASPANNGRPDASSSSSNRGDQSLAGSRSSSVDPETRDALLSSPQQQRNAQNAQKGPSKAERSAFLMSQRQTATSAAPAATPAATSASAPQQQQHDECARRCKAAWDGASKRQGFKLVANGVMRICALGTGANANKAVALLATPWPLRSLSRWPAAFPGEEPYYAQLTTVDLAIAGCTPAALTAALATMPSGIHQPVEFEVVADADYPGDAGTSENASYVALLPTATGIAKGFAKPCSGTPRIAHYARTPGPVTCAIALVRARNTPEPFELAAAWASFAEMAATVNRIGTQCCTGAVGWFADDTLELEVVELVQPASSASTSRCVYFARPAVTAASAHTWVWWWNTTCGCPLPNVGEVVVFTSFGVMTKLSYDGFKVAEVASDQLEVKAWSSHSSITVRRANDNSASAAAAASSTQPSTQLTFD